MEVTEIIKYHRLMQSDRDNIPPHIKQYIQEEFKTEKERKEARKMIAITNYRGGLTMVDSIGKYIVMPLHKKLYNYISELRKNEQYKDKSNIELMQMYVGNEQTEKEIIASAVELKNKYPRAFRFYKKHIEEALEPASTLKLIMQSEHEVYLAIIKKPGGFEWFVSLICKIRDALGLQPYEKTLEEIKKSVNDYIEQKKKEVEKYKGKGVM